MSVIALLATGLIANCAVADEICNIKGATLSCGTGELSQLINAGSLKLEGTFVSGETNVSGTFRSEGAHLASASIAGSTELNQSDISGPLQITGATKMTNNHMEQSVKIAGHLTSQLDSFAQDVQVAGPIEAEGSVFGANLQVSANDISFSHVEANAINVLPSSSTHKQSLYLRDGTQVHGNISFASGNGLVFITSGSTVDGEIIGAEVFHGD